MGGLKIPKYKEMSMKHKLNTYNKPDKVYIPLERSKNETSTILVKKDDYVFKGSLLGKRKGKFNLPVFSTPPLIFILILE